MGQSTTNKPQRKVYKKIRPTVDVDKRSSCHHQCIKALGKTAKLVKGFLIQRIIRKETHADDDSFTKLKATDHSIIAKYIAYNQLGIGSALTTPAERDDISNTVSLFLNHKRMKSSVDEWKNKISSITNDGQANTSFKSGKKLKNLLKQRNISMTERTQAVFLESLENCKSDVIEKRRKKQLTQSERKLKNKEKQDLSIYMPAIDRKSSNAHVPVDDAVTSIPARMVATATTATTTAAAAPVPTSHMHNPVIDGKDWKQTGVHPSWAARKLNISKSTDIGVFVGKKIIFDDDDE